MIELAVVAGVDPERYSWRDLEIMAEARDSMQWNHTYAILAQLFNANRGSDVEAIDPMAFNPWTPSKGSSARTDELQEDHAEAVFESHFNERAKARQADRITRAAAS